MATMATTSNVDRVVRGLSGYLRGLARRRNSGTVTADDAARFLARQGITDGFERMSFTNRVLNTNSSTFVSTGETTPSERPTMRGSRITTWALA